MSGSASKGWLRGVDLNHRPLGYEPNELPDCSTPHPDHNNRAECRQTAPSAQDAVDLGVALLFLLWLPTRPSASLANANSDPTSGESAALSCEG